MVPELEKPNVTEIQVRIDCNGCVHKIKKALHRINDPNWRPMGGVGWCPYASWVGPQGIYDIYIDMPQQKLTVIGWADPEKIVKAIKKTRKNATICSHTAPMESESSPEDGAPFSDDPANLPGEEAPSLEPPDALAAPPPNGYTTYQPPQSTRLREVEVAYHHPPDHQDGVGVYSGWVDHYPGGRGGSGFTYELPQPSHVNHSYNRYDPTPYVTEYEYIRPPPDYTPYSRPEPPPPQPRRYTDYSWPEPPQAYKHYSRPEPPQHHRQPGPPQNYSQPEPPQHHLQPGPSQHYSQPEPRQHHRQTGPPQHYSRPEPPPHHHQHGPPQQQNQTDPPQQQRQPEPPQHSFPESTRRLEPPQQYTEYNRPKPPQQYTEYNCPEPPQQYTKYTRPEPPQNSRESTRPEPPENYTEYHRPGPPQQYTQASKVEPSPLYTYYSRLEPPDYMHYDDDYHNSTMNDESTSAFDDEDPNGCRIV